MISYGWVLIPEEESAQFVSAMEEILDLYQQPYDPKRPLVCLDESNKQLTIEVREPIPMELLMVGYVPNIAPIMKTVIPECLNASRSSESGE